MMRETDLLVGGAEERGLLEAEVSPEEEPLLVDCWDFCCCSATRCLDGPAMMEGVGELSCEICQYSQLERNWYLRQAQKCSVLVW